MKEVELRLAKTCRCWGTQYIVCWECVEPINYDHLEIELEDLQRIIKSEF